MKSFTESVQEIVANRHGVHLPRANWDSLDEAVTEERTLSGSDVLWAIEHTRTGINENMLKSLDLIVPQLEICVEQLVGTLGKDAPRGPTFDQA